MKRIVILLALLSFAACTTDSKEEIRENARKHSCDIRPINGMIQYFVHSTYRMPLDYQDFLHFLYLWKENDPFFSEMERIEGYSILDSLSHAEIQFAAYEDSVFFYFPKDEIGSYIIGTPRFWLEHPEAYPEVQCQRDAFLPAAFANNGEYLFNIDYNHLQMILNSIQDDYPNKIIYPGYEFDIFSRSAQRKMIPLCVMMKYDVHLKEIEICSRVPDQDSLYFYNKRYFEDTTRISLPINNLCRNYLDDLTSVMDSLAKHNINIYRIIAISPLSF